MNDLPQQTISQAELLKRVAGGRAQLLAAWQDLTPEQMTRRSGPQEGWSVKDLIAHIAWWEDRIVALVDALVAGDPSPPWQEVDVANAETLAANRDRPLAEILAEFETNGSRLESCFLGLSDEQINQPGLYNTFENSALLPFIAGDTYEHYHDHLADIASFRRRVTGKI